MRRFSLGLITTSLAVMLLGLFTAGCGGSRDRDDDDDEYRPTRRTKKTIQVTQLKPIKATEYGVLKGKITWKGDEPNYQELTNRLHESMAANPDHKYCLMGKDYETNQQEYRIGANKGLGNVIVWIEAPSGMYFEIPKEQLEPFAKSEVRLTQPHCAFLPHCSVLFPSYYKDGAQVPTGQKFIVVNDAKVGHNANIKFPLSGASNQSVAPGVSKEVPVNVEKGTINISCDIHKWMTAYARAFDHPYAAVSSVGGNPEKKIWENLSSPDVGTYEIKGVPVGAKVKLFAWHEKAGFLGKGGQSGEEITLQKENVKDFDAPK